MYSLVQSLPRDSYLRLKASLGGINTVSYFRAWKLTALAELEHCPVHVVRGALRGVQERGDHADKQTITSCIISGSAVQYLLPALRLHNS